LSELIKWFEKRRETKALETVKHHLAIATQIAEELEKAVKTAVNGNEKEFQECVKRVTSSEKEADMLRRRVMDELAKGELPPADRVDLMDLVKRVDMIADWCRESTRILGALSMEHMPVSIKNQCIEMVEGVKQITILAQKCVNKIMTRTEEALQAADEVERAEEKIDDLHEKARILLGKEDFPRAGTAVLVSQLFETLEMVADSCEDVCDQVRIIVVRK